MALPLSAGRGAAVCGDYVRLAGQPAESRQGEHPFSCRGPTCSSKDSLPAVPPGLIDRAAPPEDLQPTAAAFFALSGPSLDHLAWPAPLLPLPPVESLFHPPR
jgi:hypothetical protein